MLFNIRKLLTIIPLFISLISYSQVGDFSNLYTTGFIEHEGTGYLRFPLGTTAQRPGSPANGMMRYNSSNNKFEAYEDGVWKDVITASSGVTIGVNEVAFGGTGGSITSSPNLTFDEGVRHSSNSPRYELFETDIVDNNFELFLQGSLLSFRKVNDAETSFVSLASLDLPTNVWSFNGGKITNVDRLTLATLLSGGTAKLTINPASYLDLTADSVHFNNTKATGLSDPVNPQDAVTLNYFDTNTQPLDSDLTAIAGLSTTGIIVRTGTGTATTRTITGTANRIDVTNGDGVSGNPTLDFPDSLSIAGAMSLNGTSALLIPSGTTGQRPSTPSSGMLRNNTTTTKLEGYEAGAWKDLITGASGGSIGENEIGYGDASGNLISSPNATFNGSEFIVNGSAQIDDIRINTNTITRADLTGRTVISGGGSSSTGANIWLYGSSEPSTPNDIQFRTDNDIRLLWDHSGLNWDYQDTDITNIGQLTGNNINWNGSRLTIDGGSATAQFVAEYDGTHTYSVDSDATQVVTNFSSGGNVTSLKQVDAGDFTIDNTAGDIILDPTGNTNLLAGGLEIAGTEVISSARSFTIPGGTINNTVIGDVTPAAGSFTTLSASTSSASATNVLTVGNTDGALRSLSIEMPNGSTASGVRFKKNTNQSWHFTNDAGTNLFSITNAGAVSTNGGSLTAGAGSFTTLNASGDVTATGDGLIQVQRDGIAQYLRMFQNGSVSELIAFNNNSTGFPSFNIIQRNNVPTSRTLLGFDASGDAIFFKSLTSGAITISGGNDLLMTGDIAVTGSRVNHLYTVSQTTTNAEAVDSDEKLKKNIDTLSGATNKIKQLRAVKYHWKDSVSRGSGQHFGLVAQEVEEVFPEIVTISIDSLGNETKGVRYTEIIPYLIKMVQEQQEEIEKLKAKQK